MESFTTGQRISLKTGERSTERPEDGPPIEEPPDPTVPPAAPSELKLTPINSTRINLNWKDNSNNETGFVVQMKIEPDGEFNDVSESPFPPNTTFYPSNGLIESTQYTYQVQAFNDAGYSAFSEKKTETAHCPNQNFECPE